MRIGICDDIREDSVKAEKFLWEGNVLNPEKDIIQLYLPGDVEVDLEEDQFSCDVMVMDIEFKRDNMDGIRLSKQINEKAPDCQIVYLTHILEFAPEVYETEHCYFVMKNNMQVMLPRAVKKAKYLYDKETGQKMVELISGGKKVYINQKDIMYIEKEQRVIHVCTRNKAYDAYQSLAAIGRQLDEWMVRCHGSFLINLNYVSDLGTDCITMKDGKEIPIGKTYREQTKKAYLRFWVERV